MVREVIVQANRFLEVSRLNEEIAPIGTVTYRVSSFVSLVYDIQTNRGMEGHSPICRKYLIDLAMQLGSCTGHGAQLEGNQTKSSPPR